MWIKSEVEKIVRKTEKLMSEQGKTEVDAIATVVANWGVPFKIFIPIYQELYGHVPESLAKYLDPDCPWVG